MNKIAITLSKKCDENCTYAYDLYPMKGENQMKLFISQPMKGKSGEEIKAERDYVAKKFPDAEIINSFFEVAPADATPLWYLGESIKLLGEADVVYFCDGWHDANGCTIEHECAVQYGINIVGE